jgi:2-hydroxy-3-oxopropionate reductase
MREPVGFIGLGIMGRSMAHNLLKAGFDVTVWNRTTARTDPLVKAGARSARTPAEMAGTCNVVISCVSDTPDVEQVILGKDGVLSGAQGGSLVIDMSTINPNITREIGRQLAERAVHFLDAPVSGGSQGAAQGTLSIMVGGNPDQVERARPYFEAMGQRITHVGVVGAGQTVKMVNQILVVLNMLSVSEALTFAQANGVDLNRCLEAVSGGAAGSWSLSNRGPQMIARDWQPGFTIDLQQKDLRLVLDAAENVGVPLIGTSLVYQLYRSLQSAGFGNEGNQALIKAIERLSGFEVGSPSEQ